MRDQLAAEFGAAQASFARWNRTLCHCVSQGV
jgi:hypothetical protein